MAMPHQTHVHRMKLMDEDMPRGPQDAAGRKRLPKEANRICGPYSEREQYAPLYMCREKQPLRSHGRAQMTMGPGSPCSGDRRASVRRLSGSGSNGVTEGVMMTYAELRWRVLAKLSPEADVTDCERALYGIAHAAVSGGAGGATLNQFTSDRDWSLVEHAMTELEAHFANEIAELRRTLAADPRPVAERAAALWQEFIGAPPP
jgi:hypothetical protein